MERIIYEDSDRINGFILLPGFECDVKKFLQQLFKIFISLKI
jgi:hypothetical protein